MDTHASAPHHITYGRGSRFVSNYHHKMKCLPKTWCFPFVCAIVLLFALCLKHDFKNPFRRHMLKRISSFTDSNSQTKWQSTQLNLSFFAFRIWINGKQPYSTAPSTIWRRKEEVLRNVVMERLGLCSNLQKSKNIKTSILKLLPFSVFFIQLLHFEGCMLPVCTIHWIQWLHHGPTTQNTETNPFCFLFVHCFRKCTHIVKLTST